MSDALTDLACRARDGDDAAAAAFVRASQGAVHRFVVALAGRAAADDLVQETYLRAFRSLDTFAGRSTALTWVLAIARRVCADDMRKQMRSPAATNFNASDALSAIPDPRHDVSGAVTSDALLRSLDPERYEAFVLTQLMGFSYQEAADVCGCAVGTIRSRVFRAREQLIESLQEPGEAESTA